VNVAVGEANDVVAARFEPAGARRIVFGLIRSGVRVAINFNYQLGASAIKIGNEAVDDVLPPNLETSLAAAHSPPDFVLGGCEWMAKIAGAGEQGRYWQ
jgi:hypothetical protein